MSADILRELALAKAMFQLRAIEAVIYAGAPVDRSPKGQDGATRLDRNDESAVPKAGAQNTR